MCNVYLLTSKTFAVTNTSANFYGIIKAFAGTHVACLRLTSIAFEKLSAVISILGLCISYYKILIENKAMGTCNLEWLRSSFLVTVMPDPFFLR